MAITLKNIAHAVGVSPQVVAAVLTGRGTARSSTDTRNRILTVAAEMGYSPNASARSLATGKSWNIELQAHSYGDALYHVPQHHLPLWAAVSQYCQEHKYNLLLATRYANDEQALLRNLTQRNVDAVMVLGASERSVLEAVQLEGVPTLCVNPEMSPSTLAEAGYHVINFDNAAGVRVAIEYLIGLGHQEIGFVRGRSRNSDFTERWDAFRETMDRHGLPIRDTWVWQASPRLQCGEEVGKQILSQERWPTAILAANDNLALGILRTLLAADVRVPRDISLVGFDDIDASSIVYPGLTTVRLDWHGMGLLAAERLLSVLQTGVPLMPEERRYPLHLVERQSCCRNMQR